MRNEAGEGRGGEGRGREEEGRREGGEGKEGGMQGRCQCCEWYLFSLPDLQP